MCEFIKPKKLTFEKEMGLPSKPQIKPLLSSTIEPPKNLIFNKELYKSPISTPQEQPIKEENKDTLSDEDPPERPITPIDDGEEIDVPLIPSNQLGLLKMPPAGTLNNFDFIKFLYIFIYLLFYSSRSAKQAVNNATRKACAFCRR